VNPFNYQGPVGPARLIDRRSELDDLQRAAADRVAVRLAAPRRFGKSSLLDAHILAMREAGHRAVRVDFSKVATLGDVAARVAGSFGDLLNDPGRSARASHPAHRRGRARHRGSARRQRARPRPRRRRVARRVARSTLQEALERLLADERHVKRDADGKPHLLDPLLAEWLKRR